MAGKKYQLIDNQLFDCVFNLDATSSHEIFKRSETSNSHEQVPLEDETVPCASDTGFA